MITEADLAELRKAFADLLTERNTLAAGIAAISVALGTPARDTAIDTVAGLIARAAMLKTTLDTATRLGSLLAGLECNSRAEESFASMRKEAGLDAL